MPLPLHRELRVLVVRDPRTRDWIARFEDDPSCRFRSPSPESALRGLLDRNLHKLPPNYGVAEVSSDYWKGRIEAVIFRRERCPDCGGSGKYVGLVVIEACQTCEGKGYIRR